jgi:hypothetical protein
MSNDFFTVSGYPSFGANGDSASARTEFAAVQAGFEKLPTMTACAGYLVRVKSTADALESVPVATVATPTVVGTLLHAAALKTPPVDTDEIVSVDSAASFIQVRITWANIKAALYTALGALIAAGTGKTTPVGADSIAISDSAAAGATKTLTFTNLVAYQAGLCSAGWNAATATLAINATHATNVSGGTVSGDGSGLTGITVITATTANRVDSGMVTVASSTFPDIFAAAGNTINYTGTVPCAGFTAAPKAGMTRTLICSGTCTFTASANLLIEGINSGNTITLGTGAIVNVVAMTTTQHKMTYSYSGSFTMTGTGFTSNPTGTATFVTENGVVNLTVPTLSGTSNSVAFTLSGLPAAIQSLITPINTPAFNAVDTNNTLAYGQLHAAQAYISLYTVLPAAQTWTTGSTKTMMATTLTYRIN